MKYLLVLLLTINSAYASGTLNKYYKEYSKSDIRQIKARQRADAHPQGSGIGTNKYNIRYDRDYKVYGYSRNCCDVYKD